MDLESQVREKHEKLNAFIKIFRSFESSIHDEFKDI